MLVPVIDCSTTVPEIVSVGEMVVLELAVVLAAFIVVVLILSAAKMSYNSSAEDRNGRSTGNQLFDFMIPVVVLVAIVVEAFTLFVAKTS